MLAQDKLHQAGTYMIKLTMAGPILYQAGTLEANKGRTQAMPRATSSAYQVNDASTR